jgi:hypothetical protein
MLEILLKDISMPLLNGDNKQLILDESTYFPLLKHGIIEFTEKPYTERVDLMLCVFSREAKRVLRFMQEDNSFPREWSFLKEFFIQWIDEEGLLAQTLENIYIVFDNESGRKAEEKPWIYLAFRKLDLSPDILHSLFIKSAVFVPGVINVQMQKLLDLCLSSIRNPHWIFGYGLLHGRAQNKIRLGICGFREIAQISDYLGRIGWTGSRSDFEQKLLFMDTFSESFVLAIDLGDTIEKRIGIECVIRKKEHITALEAILMQLKSKFDYKDDRGKALLALPGNLKTGVDKQVIERWINHIKLVFTSDGEIELKPYLYYNILTAE